MANPNLFKNLPKFDKSKLIMKQTEYYKNGAIKAFHKSVKSFKNIVDFTYQDYDGKDIIDRKLVLYLDKNGQVYDVIENGSRANDLYHTFKGRPYNNL